VQTKISPGWNFGQCVGLHFARKGEGAGDAIEVAKVAMQGFSRCTTAVALGVAVDVLKFNLVVVPSRE